MDETSTNLNEIFPNFSAEGYRDYLEQNDGRLGNFPLLDYIDSLGNDELSLTMSGRSIFCYDYTGKQLLSEIRMEDWVFELMYINSYPDTFCHDAADYKRHLYNLAPALQTTYETDPNNE